MKRLLGAALVAAVLAVMAAVSAVEVKHAKVTLCHKGKVTITVDDSAAAAHYAHGDLPGPCPASPSK